MPEKTIWDVFVVCFWAAVFTTVAITLGRWRAWTATSSSTPATQQELAASQSKS